MSIESTHPDYNEMLPEWELCRAACSGQKAIKRIAKNILKIPGSNTSKAGTVTYNAPRFANYVKGAIYTNVSGRTEKGLVGAAFREPPTIDIRGKLDYIERNSDGTGQGLEQMSKDVLGNLIKTGRELLLCDFPVMEAGLTEEQVKSINPQVSFKRYSALDLDNWSSASIGGKEVITMLKLREEYNSSNDEFEYDNKIQYRVLRLEAIEGYSTAVYTQEVVRDGDAGDRVVIKNFSGGTFDYIPAVCVGSQNNDISVDEVPISSIAYVNVGHFQNSADQEESAFITGQAMLHIDVGEMDATEFTAANGEDGISFGSTSAIQTKKGSIELIQGLERTVYTALREEKMNEMIALGARLIENRETLQTATAAKIDATGQNSVLGDLVSNVEDGMRFMLRCAAEFEGETIEPDKALIFSREFFPDDLPAEMVMAAVQGFTAAVAPRSVALKAMQRAGLIDKDQDLMLLEGEIESTGPLNTARVQGEQ